jgi:hypothetical protein
MADPMSAPTPLLPVGARVASPAGVLGTVASREDSRGWALVVLDVAQRGRTIASYAIDALRIVGMSGPAVVGARVLVMGHGRGVVTDYHDGLEACTVVVRHDDGRTDEYVTESHEGDMLDTVVVLPDAPAEDDDDAHARWTLDLAFGGLS